MVGRDMIYRREYTVHMCEADARGPGRPVALPVPDAGLGPAFLHQALHGATGAELARLRTKWS